MYSTYQKAYQPAQYNVSNLNYGANNQYKGFPPKMADSRSLVSSSQPVSVTDFFLKNNVNNSNWAYREYLKNNATAIEKEMQRNSFNDVGYYQRFIKNLSEYPETTTPAIPYFYTSLFTGSNAKPFGFEDSNVKQMYLTKEQLNARLMSPKV